MPEQIQLTKIGKRMGLKALKEISCVVQPETIMKWFRKLVAKKFDGSSFQKIFGRPPISSELERLIIRFAEENSGWGYDGIAGYTALRYLDGFWGENTFVKISIIVPNFIQLYLSLSFLMDKIG